MKENFIINEFKKWKTEHDPEYQYHMVHDFLDRFGISDLLTLLEWGACVSKSIDGEDGTK